MYRVLLRHPHGAGADSSFVKQTAGAEPADGDVEWAKDLPSGFVVKSRITLVLDDPNQAHYLVRALFSERVGGLLFISRSFENTERLQRYRKIVRHSGCPPHF